MAVLGLHFFARAFSSCSKWGPLFIAVRGPLIIVASLVAEHRLQTHRLSSGSWAQLLRSMWDLPKPELEPVSPALAGRFSITVPPGKPPQDIFKVMKGKNLQPRLLYPARISFRFDREIKTFTDKQKLREFSTTKPALQ